MNPPAFLSERACQRSEQLSDLSFKVRNSASFLLDLVEESPQLRAVLVGQRNVDQQVRCKEVGVVDDQPIRAVLQVEADQNAHTH